MPPPTGVTPGTSNAPASTSRAYGSFGIPYTSTRVILGANSASSSVGGYLSASAPYRSIGKLFFDVPGGGAACTATVIRRSVIVTAAHCIQDFGSGSSTFSNWVFVPGYYQSSASAASELPYGVWDWDVVARPPTWAAGTDPGSGAARNNDLAVIVLQKNGAGQFIGDITGKMGYGWNNPSFVSSTKTGKLATAATSTLGYPGLLDGGRIMQRVDGPTYQTIVSTALQYWQGGNLTGGASGGPWIVNFKFNPVYSSGAGPGVASSTAIIGVTSWGSPNPNTPKDNYASRFGQNRQFPNSSYGPVPGAGNIGYLLNSACSAIVPGTSNTYTQLGYCS